MGKGRWLHTGLCHLDSAAMITVSSAKAGEAGIVQPSAQGVANMYPSGEYTGEDDLLYTVEIDSVASGKDIGQATFRWKRFDSSGWEQDGIVTSGSPIALDKGLSVRFMSGTGGNQFELYDKFEFFATRIRGRAKLIDLDPDSYWEATSNTDENITVDLGSAQNVTAVWIGDHNLTSGATVTLKANSIDGGWTSPDYEQALSVATPHICLFMDQTKAYWRLEISDAANGDNIRIGHLFIGTYFEPSRDYRLKYSQGRDYPLKGERPVGPAAKKFSLEYGSATEADQAALEALWDAIYDTTNLIRRPAVFCPNSEAPGVTVLGFPPAKFTKKQEFLSRFSLAMTFNELPRRVR